MQGLAPCWRNNKLVKEIQLEELEAVITDNSTIWMMVFISMQRGHGLSEKWTIIERNESHAFQWQKKKKEIYKNENKLVYHGEIFYF